ncbi:MAG: zinc-dependent alcohol dehydrogenase [Pseudomonadota bacterium]|nr:zinc-dependent alcohol dehydrogenase [Pseudomonadota bacterium]HJO34687.1 zinc-dependent alcohol dehydrogenase [Gammaproteobacteria bacterium]
MKALVYHAPKHVQVDEVDDPRLEGPRDAIIRVTRTAICGSDLHIYNGLFPQLRNEIIGHEFMGIVEEVGSGVTHLQRGDRVVVPFPIACGACFFCEHDWPTHCENSNPEHYGPDGDVLKEKGGGLFGYTDLYGGYAGGQAEYVRVPYADVGPRKVPESLNDEQVLFLTDIYPTGWAAADWAQIQPGETVAVFGCGPVGLMAQKAAWLQGAGRVIGIDILPYRLEQARRSANSEVINAAEVDPVEALRELTEGRGADRVIDAVGMEADRSLLDKTKAVLHLERGSDEVIETALRAVRRGGTVSVIGVYATSYDNFPVGRLVDKAITLRFGQAPVHRYIDDLLTQVREEKVVLDDIISHRLPLTEAAQAYEMFSKKQDDCVKVVLQP